MFTSTISETARANRALCFSNVVSSCNIRISSTRSTQSTASPELGTEWEENFKLKHVQSKKMHIHYSGDIFQKFAKFFLHIKRARKTVDIIDVNCN